jgi:hypothetical protein
VIPTPARIALPLPDQMPVACSDCSAVAVPSDLLTVHDPACPIAASIATAYRADRAFFNACPHVAYLLRPMVWGEAVHLRLAGVTGALVVDMAALLRLLVRVELDNALGVPMLRRTIHAPERPR